MPGTRPNNHHDLMRIFLLLAFIAYLTYTFGVTAQAAIPNPFPPGDVLCSTLGNGLRLVVREEHSLPIVAITVVVRGGSASQANSRGIAHYLEHLIFQGSAQFPQPQAAQLALEEAGGMSDADTARDSTQFEAAASSAQAALLVKILADVTLQPLLTDAAFQRERPPILQEIEHHNDDPVASALAHAYLAAYAAHPYRNSPMGSIQEVLALTPEEVRAFHHTWYVPNNMSVVLVGDITPQRATGLVLKEFGGAEAAPLPPLPPPEPTLLPAEPQQLIDTDRPDVYQVLAFPAPGSGNIASLAATDLLVTLLTDGSEALLPGWWSRNQVKAAAFGGEFVSARDPGRLLLWMRSAPEYSAPLCVSTLALLRSLAATPAPAALLEAAKQRLASGYLHDNETYSQQATTLACYEALGGEGAMLVTRYLDTVQAITPETLSRAVPTAAITRVVMMRQKEEDIGK